ncbi:MAG: hypothetical protein AB1Z98_22695 [Nannocystaceae bacterium]
MTDLNDFIGSNRTNLKYVIDGVSTGIGASIVVPHPTVATLTGSNIAFRHVVSLSGTINIQILDSTNASITVSFVVDGMPMDTDTIKAQYTVSGSVLNVSASSTPYGDFKGSLSQIDSGQNTKICAAFSKMFDGDQICADLVPAQ